MKSIIGLCIILFWLTSGLAQTTDSLKKYQEFFHNGKLKLDGFKNSAGKLSGLAIYYDEEGNKRYEFSYNNGLFEAEAKLYGYTYESDGEYLPEPEAFNGLKVKERGEYKLLLQSEIPIYKKVLVDKDGKEIHKNNQKLIFYFASNDKVFMSGENLNKKDRINGKVRVYRKDGTLLLEGHNLLGKFDKTEWRSYNKKGKLKSKEVLDY